MIAAAAIVAGCGTPPTLTNTFESDETAVRAVLDAVAANDAERLISLSLTKEEFETIVWPTLSVSRPEVGMPMDYVWQDTSSKSRAYLAKALDDYGGQRLNLAHVEFRGNTTEHEGYTVSRKTYLIVTDETGEQKTIRLFGSIIRQDGRSKIYSYIVD